MVPLYNVCTVVHKATAQPPTAISVQSDLRRPVVRRGSNRPGKPDAATTITDTKIVDIVSAGELVFTVIHLLTSRQHGPRRPSGPGSAIIAGNPPIHC